MPKGRGFVSHSSSKKMGVITRDASKGGRVFIGKRTVKQGECMGKWDMDGAYEVVEGKHGTAHTHTHTHTHLQTYTHTHTTRTKTHTHTHTHMHICLWPTLNSFATHPF